MPRHCGRITRSRLAQLIEQGRLLVNGQVARPSLRLKTGARLQLSLPEPQPVSLQPEAIAITILHEDADLVVVDKPAGMVVHPGAGVRSGTLVNALLHRVRDLAGIGGEIPARHRPSPRQGDLGRPGGGEERFLLDVSRRLRSRPARWRSATSPFATACRGPTIDTPFGRHRTSRVRMTGGPAASGLVRRAVTHLVVAEVFGGDAARLEVTLETGRTHQYPCPPRGIGPSAPGRRAVRRDQARQSRGALRAEAGGARAPGAARAGARLSASPHRRDGPLRGAHSGRPPARAGDPAPGSCRVACYIFAVTAPRPCALVVSGYDPGDAGGAPLVTRGRMESLGRLGFAVEFVRDARGSASLAQRAGKLLWNARRLLFDGTPARWHAAAWPAIRRAVDCLCPQVVLLDGLRTVEYGALLRREGFRGRILFQAHNVEHDLLRRQRAHEPRFRPAA